MAGHSLTALGLSCSCRAPDEFEQPDRTRSLVEVRPCLCRSQNPATGDHKHLRWQRSNTASVRRQMTAVNHPAPMSGWPT
jgi:hypothetical protein